MKKKQPSDCGDKDWYEKGRRLARHGSHREAIEALDLAIEKNPLNAAAYFIRGASRYALGRYQGAGDDLDAAAILGCRDAQLWSKHSVFSTTTDGGEGQDR